MQKPEEESKAKVEGKTNASENKDLEKEEAQKEGERGQPPCARVIWRSQLRYLQPAVISGRQRSGGIFSLGSCVHVWVL